MPLTVAYSAPCSDSLIGTKFADCYAIVSLIVLGGMSTVYKAKHLLMDRFVANQGSWKCRHHKSQAISVRGEVNKLAHPNIVTVFDFGVSDKGQPYLVMDYLHGLTSGAKRRKRSNAEK